MAKEFYLETFEGMAARAIRQRNQGHWFNMPMPPAGVLAPLMMAGFLLLVACFNFTNNAIAMAGKRLKILGASDPHILLKVSQLFLIVMAFSFVLGSLMGATLVNALMDSVWEYYVAVNPTILMAAVFILLTIATATIYSIVTRATRANPAQALRYE